MKRFYLYSYLAIVVLLLISVVSVGSYSTDGSNVDGLLSTLAFITGIYLLLFGLHTYLGKKFKYVFVTIILIYILSVMVAFWAGCMDSWVGSCAKVGGPVEAYLAVVGKSFLAIFMFAALLFY